MSNKYRYNYRWGAAKRNAAILKERKAGDTWEQIGERHGITPHWARQIFNRVHTEQQRERKDHAEKNRNQGRDSLRADSNLRYRDNRRY